MQAEHPKMNAGRLAKSQNGGRGKEDHIREKDLYPQRP